MALETVKYIFDANVSKFKSAVKGARDASDDFRKKTVANAEKFSSAFKTASDKTSRLSFFAGSTLVAGLSASIKQAVDFNEVVSKTDVVFGKSSASVKKWASDLNTQFGLSDKAALDAVSRYGALANAMGLPEEKTKKYSIALTGLASDLASFNNTSIPEAQEALNAIFTGEAEPLKKYGIVLTEEKVKQEAYASGIAKTGAELNDAQKIQARYQLTMKASSDANGDFARTNEGAANQTRIMKANIEDLAVQIGEKFLPYVQKGLDKVNEFLEKMKENPNLEKFVMIGIAILAVTAIISPLLGAISSIITIVGAVSSAISFLIPLIGAISLPVLGIIAVVVAVIAIIVLLIMHFDKVKAVLKVVGSAFVAFGVMIKNVFVALWNNIIKPVLDKIVAGFRSWWNGIKAILNGLIQFIKGVFTGNFKSAFAGLRKALDAWGNGIKGAFKGYFNGVIGIVKGVVNKIKGMFNAMGDSVKKTLSKLNPFDSAFDYDVNLRGDTDGGERGSIIHNNNTNYNIQNRGLTKYDRNVSIANIKKGVVE